MDNPSELKGCLLLQKRGVSFLEDKRVRLLEAIQSHGSISSAAKAVSMSYKGAWDMVDAMNNQSDQPVVSRSTGGKHGGGTQLTEYGINLIRLFRQGENQYLQWVNTLTQGVDNLEVLQQHFSRFSLRTSARNQFFGRIVKLVKGSVNVDVRVQLDQLNQIAATVTVESAETLSLAVGTEVYALIKAPSVLLATEQHRKYSAENRLYGTVSRIHEGEVTAEVTLVLENEKTITSVATREALASLELVKGTQTYALFPASSVILAR